MTASEKPQTAKGPTVKGMALSPQQRADRVRELLVRKNAPPLEEGDAVRKLSSNSTLAVIMMTDDLFRAAGFTETPSWEQYSVICGVIACLADAITQFTGLPQEGLPYMVADAVHFLFSGPEREKWPKMETTYNFAVTQYRHMINTAAVRPHVDDLGRGFYNFLGGDDIADIEIMKREFKILIDTPDVHPEILARGAEFQAN